MTVKNLYPMVNKITEHSLREISGVELEEIKQGDGEFTCEVKLLTLAGDRICLSAGTNRAEQQKIAELVRSYLKARSN